MSVGRPVTGAGGSIRGSKYLGYVFGCAFGQGNVLQDRHLKGVLPLIVRVPPPHHMGFFEAAGGGVEPPLSVPETDVLPLDDPAVTAALF